MGLKLSHGFCEGKELWCVITPFFIFKCPVTSGIPALYFIVQISVFDSNLLLFVRREVFGRSPPKSVGVVGLLAEEWILALTVNIKGRGINQLLINFFPGLFLINFLFFPPNILILKRRDSISIVLFSFI